MPSSSRNIVMIKPVADPSNDFVKLFSDAVAAHGPQVVDFAWDRLVSGEADVAILHWPYELLGIGNLASARRWLRCSSAIKAARKRGMRVIWIAHNVQPHDGGVLSSLLMRRFLRSIDGIVHLSAHSHALLDRLYAPPPRVAQIETVHGHYLDAMETPFRPAPSLSDGIRIAYFGQIRPYKNAETLAQLAAQMPLDFQLTIAGRGSHAGVVGQIERIAAEAPNIELDIRSEPLPNAVIEHHLDEAHAVVLPYQAILNSGAAIFALSRGRPVLAPRTGSLPELQAAVGPEWLQLYDGEINVAVLRDFTAWLRARPALERPDLSAYSWERVGRDIVGLIDRLKK